MPLNLSRLRLRVDALAIRSFVACRFMLVTVLPSFGLVVRGASGPVMLFSYVSAFVWAFFCGPGGLHVGWAGEVSFLAVFFSWVNPAGTVSIPSSCPFSCSFCLSIFVG